MGMKFVLKESSSGETREMPYVYFVSREKREHRRLGIMRNNGIVGCNMGRLHVYNVKTGFRSMYLDYKTR